LARLIPYAPLAVTVFQMHLPGHHVEGMTFQVFWLIVGFAVFTMGVGVYTAGPDLSPPMNSPVGPRRTWYSFEGMHRTKTPNRTGGTADIIINASWLAPEAWYSSIANNFSSFLHPVVIIVLYSPPAHGEMDGIIFKGTVLRRCTQQKHNTGKVNMAAIIINASCLPPGAWYSVWGYSYRDTSMLWLSICSQDGIFYF
jgi:hypothetical protein